MRKDVKWKAKPILVVYEKLPNTRSLLGYVSLITVSHCALRYPCLVCYFRLPFKCERFLKTKTRKLPIENTSNICRIQSLVWAAIERVKNTFLIYCNDYRRSIEMFLVSWGWTLIWWTSREVPVVSLRKHLTRFRSTSFMTHHDLFQISSDGLKVQASHSRHWSARLPLKLHKDV